MAGAGAFDGLAERLQRARAEFELRPSQQTWIALLEAENAWLRRQLRMLGLRPGQGPKKFLSGGFRDGG